MSTSKVVIDLSPLLKIYEDGHLERLSGTSTVPPSLDHPQTLSKDVVFSPELNLSSRLYLPKSIPTDQKLPLLVYFHGGAFCIETAFSPTYHNYLNQLVAEAKVVVVSVDYRRAPEHHLPAAYEDSWTALKWVSSHSNRNGQEGWLIDHADFDKVFLAVGPRLLHSRPYFNKAFLACDSAGANIAHFIAMKFGQEKLVGISIVGIVLVHPYFGGKEIIGDEFKNLEMKSMCDSLWLYAYPSVSGLDDPVINPGLDPKLGDLGCKKILVVVAERDVLKSRGWDYYEKVKMSGWDGFVEIIEAKEEEHIFHLMNPNCDNAVSMLKKIAAFLNH